MTYNGSAHGIGAHSWDNSGRYVPGIFAETHAAGSTKKRDMNSHSYPVLNILIITG